MAVPTSPVRVGRDSGCVSWQSTALSFTIPNVSCGTVPVDRFCRRTDGLSSASIAPGLDGCMLVVAAEQGEPAIVLASGPTAAIGCGCSRCGTRQGLFVLRERRAAIVKEGSRGCITAAATDGPTGSTGGVPGFTFPSTVTDEEGTDAVMCRGCSSTVEDFYLGSVSRLRRAGIWPILDDFIGATSNVLGCEVCRRAGFTAEHPKVGSWAVAPTGRGPFLPCGPMQDFSTRLGIAVLRRIRLSDFTGCCNASGATGSSDGCGRGRSSQAGRIAQGSRVASIEAAYGRGLGIAPVVLRSRPATVKVLAGALRDPSAGGGA